MVRERDRGRKKERKKERKREREREREREEKKGNDHHVSLSYPDRWPSNRRAI